MKEVSYKLGGKAARESIAALAEGAPWYAKPQLAALLEYIDERGVSIRVERVKRKHSDSQRNYYHLCLDIFAKTQGDTHDGMHEVILAEAFGSRDVKIGERIYPRPMKRSHDLNVEDYGTLIDTLHRCAAFCGCVLPDPMTVSA
jgi:hypothetical protein